MLFIGACPCYALTVATAGVLAFSIATSHLYALTVACARVPMLFVGACPWYA